MKYITKKVINGKVYYYLQYKGYSKSLGSVLPQNLKKELIDFFNGIYEKESGKLSPLIRRKFPYGGLDSLEFQKYRNICLNNELFSLEKELFHDRFVILFTYHSNRQEGSKVTKKEIETFAKSRIRKPKTKTDMEIMNSFNAFRFAISSGMKWNMKSVKHIHKLLLNGLDPVIAGRWKKEDNTAPGNNPTTPYKQVPNAMKSIIEWLNSEFRKRGVYPPELALKFYCRFENIHPFLDGNGRVGRILLNAILYKFNYPLVIFFTENQKEHSNAIQQAINGRWCKIFKHFLTQAKKTNRELMEKFIKF